MFFANANTERKLLEHKTMQSNRINIRISGNVMKIIIDATTPQTKIITYDGICTSFIRSAARISSYGSVFLDKTIKMILQIRGEIKNNATMNPNTHMAIFSSEKRLLIKNPKTKE